MRKLTTEIKETLRSIPGLVTTIFILSCVCMNLLANKSIFNTQYLAVTAGIFFSWIAFLCMDCVCKRFGSRAATILNTTATVIALVTSLMFALIVKVPGIWASVFSAPEGTGDAVNAALDGTFSSTWYIVVGSTIALCLGGLTNSIVNKLIGKKADNGTFKGFAIRSYLSTAAGQFVDNIVFAFFVSYMFFGWSIPQVIGCSFFGMLLELVIEIVFSPLGYHVSKKWKDENVGSEYLRKYASKETTNAA